MTRAGTEVGNVKLWVPESPALVSARLERGLRLSSSSMGGGVNGNHAEFHLPQMQGSARAAQLVVEIEAADGGTLVRGEFIRHPHVFVISLSIAVVCAFGVLIAGSWAFAQWSMGQTPIGLLAMVICGAAGLGAYFVSGSKLKAGSAQTDALRNFVEQAVRSPDST